MAVKRIFAAVNQGPLLPAVIITFDLSGDLADRSVPEYTVAMRRR
jgi:hypothetical protein